VSKLVSKVVSKVKGAEVADDDREGRVREVDRAQSVRIAVNRGPISDLAVSPDGGRLLVVNHGSDSVSLIDTDTRRVTGIIAGLHEPFVVAVGGHGGGRAYVSTASPAYDAIAVIDAQANAVIATHPVALRVSDLAASPDGMRVYVGRNGSDGTDLAVLDTATGCVGTVELPDATRDSTQCVRVSPDGSHLYVATNGPAGGQVFVVRAHGTPRVVGRVGIGSPIRDVALGPDGTSVCVASSAADAGAVVDVIDTRRHTITRTRSVDDIGGILTGLSISGDGDRAYLVSDCGITVLCTLTHDIIGAVAVPEPSRVLESPDAKWLYIADYSGAVTVLPVGSITGRETGDEARGETGVEGLLLSDLLAPDPAFA
jgi:YVTN family beta-propeller protein